MKLIFVSNIKCPIGNPHKICIYRNDRTKRFTIERYSIVQGLKSVTSFYDIPLKDLLRLINSVSWSHNKQFRKRALESLSDDGVPALLESMKGAK